MTVFSPNVDAGDDIFYAAKPAIKRFTDVQGLPSNAVMTSGYDQKGRFWIGTQDGAAYYNGHSWVTVNMPSRKVSNYIFDIFEMSDGSMWFATDGGGVHVLKEGKWSTIDTSNGLKTSNAVRAIAESFDANGTRTVWVGGREGLETLTGDQ